MNSLRDIWNEVLRFLSESMTQTAVQTWFSDCEPVDLEGTTLVVRTSSEFKKNIITSHYAANIESFLADLFSASSFELLVLSSEEEYIKEDPVIEEYPEIAGYTFENFIVGNSNKFAHAAAVSVSENPGKKYNPLFLYGNSGLGKTHLLWAIGHAIRTRFPEMKISYIKGDNFTNEMVKSIKEGSSEKFRSKYRKVDLLLVDDIQFIAGKQSTQNEFFHTFNDLYEAGHQIVITSDRPPMEMSLLEDRLRTRFEGGLMADIAKPDLETRMAIARNKAARLGLGLPDDIVEYIASKVTANVRQLEGVINKLTAYKEILNDRISKESVDRAIDDVMHNGEYIPKPDMIIQETAKYYSLQPEDLTGKNRSRNLTIARQIAMYLMRNLTNLSLNDIGKELGRNHTTTLTSIRKIEELMKSDANMNAVIRDITSNITNYSSSM